MLRTTQTNHDGVVLVLILCFVMGFLVKQQSFNSDQTPKFKDGREVKPEVVVVEVAFRGVSEGVSEKKFIALGGDGDGDGESFPWSNSMLSWQRTGFHFQPENNWMNGGKKTNLRVLGFSGSGGGGSVADIHGCGSAG